MWGQSREEDFTPIVQRSKGGDAYYIEESRSISDGIKFLESLSDYLERTGLTHDDVSRQLQHCRGVTFNTHKKLRDFGLLVTDSVATYEGKTQRAQTYNHLKDLFQLALRRLEKAAERAVKGDDGQTKLSFEDTITMTSMPQHPLSNAEQPITNKNTGLLSSGENNWFGSATRPFNSKEYRTKFQPSRLDISTSRRLSDSSTASSSHIDINDNSRYARYVQPMASNVMMLEQQINNEKQKCIAEIHRDIEGLHDLYLEMNDVTQRQGEHIAATQDQIQNTSITTALATEQLHMARYHQQQNWKRTLYLIFVVIGAVLGLIFVIKEF